VSIGKDNKAEAEGHLDKRQRTGLFKVILAGANVIDEGRGTRSDRWVFIFA
jgi:hypothetical protein